jgi:PilZ domain
MKSTTARKPTALAAELLPQVRRRQNRIRLQVPVRIVYQGLLSEASRDAICTDISDAGLGFETSAGLYVGEIVEVEFRDQMATPFRFRVRVLYKMANHYGAYFVSPDSTSRES